PRGPDDGANPVPRQPNDPRPYRLLPGHPGNAPVAADPRPSLDGAGAGGEGLLPRVQHHPDAFGWLPRLPAARPALPPGAPGLGQPRFGKAGLVAIGCGLWLGLFRMVPAAVAFWDFRDYPCVSGYVSLSDLVSAFTTLRAPEPQTFVDTPLARVGWWEYDVY